MTFEAFENRILSLHKHEYVKKNSVGLINREYATIGEGKHDDDKHVEKPFCTTQRQKILLCTQNLILSYRTP